MKINYENHFMIIAIIHSSCIGLLFNNSVALAGVDGWMVPLIGGLIGYLPFKMICKANHKSPVVLALALIISVLAISNITNFIYSEYLFATPKIAIMIFISLPILYILKFDFKVLKKSNTIFFLVCYFLLGLSFFMVVAKFEAQNIKPFFEFGFMPVLKASILYALYINAPLLVLPFLKESDFKWSYLISNVSVFLIFLMLLGVFGIELCQLYQYPVFQLLKRIAITTVFERFESVFALQWIIYSITTLCCCLHYIKSYFKLDKLIFPVIVALFIISFITFKNNVILGWFTLEIYPFICILIFAFIFIKEKSKA